MLDEDNKQFAYEFLRDREAYHSQKENTANAVFLLEAVLFGALVGSTSKMQVTEIVSTFGWASALSVLLVWCLLHVLMRWHLRNRRIAALQVATLLNAITDHLSGKPVQGCASRNSDQSCHCFNFLDYFVPMPRSSVIADIELERYPGWYRERFLAVQKQGTRAGFGEIFLTYGSIAMLILALGYVLLLSR